jgi:hypothetical protein
VIHHQFKKNIKYESETVTPNQRKKNRSRQNSDQTWLWTPQTPGRDPPQTLLAMTRLKTYFLIQN